ncbi:1-deoxy-D-xylulose 5-phosphate reductoisomerase [Bacteroidia bacterium]|nr:1-deoxy-D-xylulose 5-phosphate reductoisomerase [Bacteroidia bacterium]
MENEKKQIAILGSTGSIGTQALDVIRENRDLLEIYALTANNNVELLIRQAREFLPEMVVIANESKFSRLKDALSDLPVKVWAGHEAICQVVQAEPIQIVLTAMVGYSGLKPTINAINAGKTIALANKETLVVAGELIIQLALENRTHIIPVDSEHSAIFQCLTGEIDNPIEKIILTASGGPFRTFSQEQLAVVTKKEALQHPNWNMGAKVTIDSATLMNKGFEMIEAKWLFDVDTSQIQILVHPQSIIHSMVQFEDSSIKAQLSLPDMRLPIQYALTYPNRVFSNFERLDFNKFSSLTFEEPDTRKFRNLALAYEAVAKGGNMPCILNAANEVAVAAFLEDRTGFLAMSDVIEKTMEQVSFIASPNLDDYMQTDAEAREKAKEALPLNPLKGTLPKLNNKTHCSKLPLQGAGGA